MTRAASGLNRASRILPSIVFQPGGTAKAGVYTTEASLAAATQTFNGAAYTIYFDLSLVGLVYAFTTSGTINFAPNGIWSGKGTLDFPGITTTQLANPPIRMQGYSLDDGLLITIEQITAPICSVTGQGQITLDNFSGITSTISGSSPFLDVQDSGEWDIVFNGDSFSTGFASPVFTASAGTLNIWVYDSGSLGPYTTDSSVDQVVSGSSAASIDASFYGSLGIDGLFWDSAGSGPSTILTGGANIGAYMLSGGAIYYSNGTTWTQITLPSITSKNILYGQGTTTPASSSDFTWTDASQKLGIGATAAAASIVFGAAVTAASVQQTTPTSDVAPAALTITSQGPFASATTHKSSAALNLTTVAPISGGSAGAITLQPGGTTALTLAAASGDFVALGASPASAGYLRVPAVGASQNILLAGTLPLISSNSSSQWVFGNTTSVTNVSGSTTTLQPGGTTALQLAAATTDFLALGASPASAGYLRFPALATSTTYLEMGTSPIVQYTSGSVLAFGVGVAATTALAVSLSAGAGSGAASASNPGGALTLAGGASTVASSGTAAGGAGGAITATGGAGAAGLGSNQNGGAGGAVTISSGAGGAATGAGTAGAAGQVALQVGGTTALSLAAATTDFLALGASPGSAGYLRTPALAASTTYLQLGTVPVIYAQSAGSVAFGASGALLTQINSGGTLTLNTGTNITMIAGVMTMPITSGLMAPNVAFTLAPSAKTVTALTMAVNAGAGTGAASSSVAGGALSFTGGAAGVATSGTSAGAAGGALTATGGAGAAGLGSNQNGGAGGNVTLNSGTGGAATGAGTAGAAGVIQHQVAGTNVLTLGGAGLGLGLAAGAVTLTTGTTTLTATQAAFAYVDFATSTLTGACTVIFPAVATGQTWVVDATDVTFAAHAITLQINSNAMSTTISAAALWLVTYTHAGKFFAIPLSTT